ncbi:hypothetical protein Athai_68010 [Actinocatenispora thailandica]|uniref:Uncharacterized protein n=1 Tax=Actinocatenispora thailandica TaxID=227318 RepID=A0A7R7DWR4_9ACTN|nr:hypothetical protein [Actinocatenispora thailandica]BCJ39298.1 hypothetical protein Athai_68010 [Actinocatenispora thailandica]
MNATLYAATLGTALVVGLAALAGLTIYLLDRATSRRSAVVARDPYAQASALAAQRRPPAGRSAGGGEPWRRR